MRSFTLIFILIISIFFGACSSDREDVANDKQKVESKVSPELRRPFIAFNDSNLVFLISPEFTVDSIDRRLTIDTVLDNYHIRMFYEFDQEHLNHAHGQIVGSGLEEEAESLMIKHFEKFKPSHHQSEQFHTWIFDLDHRPIIELNTLIKPDTLDLEIFLRQHI